MEERTFYAEDIHEVFRHAGFYRIAVPRRYGGYEFDFEIFIQVVMTLTRGCPSTGWMICLGAAHSLVAATLCGEQAQDRLFGGGDFISPAVMPPAAPPGAPPTAAGSSRRQVELLLGLPYATHFIGHALLGRGGADRAPCCSPRPARRGGAWTTGAARSA